MPIGPIPPPRLKKVAKKTTVHHTTVHTTGDPMPLSGGRFHTRVRNVVYVGAKRRISVFLGIFFLSLLLISAGPAYTPLVIVLLGVSSLAILKLFLSFRRKRDRGAAANSPNENASDHGLGNPEASRSHAGRDEQDPPPNAEQLHVPQNPQSQNINHTQSQQQRGLNNLNNTSGHYESGSPSGLEQNTNPNMTMAPNIQMGTVGAASDVYHASPSGNQTSGRGAQNPNSMVPPFQQRNGPSNNLYPDLYQSLGNFESESVVDSTSKMPYPNTSNSSTTATGERRPPVLPSAPPIDNSFYLEEATSYQLEVNGNNSNLEKQGGKKNSSAPYI